ncbi:MAG TPA: virulence protein RhuM/Fic/DOC family protein [Candidatus Gracilibacteria bacterium]
MKDKKSTIVYQAENGAIQLRTDTQDDNIWASQSDIAQLFGKDQSVISRHIIKIFKENEVDKESNMQKMHIPYSDKPVIFYSLDVILSVGYKTNSSIAIKFRKWATQTLRSHIIDGYTINQARIDQNHKAFLKAIEETKKLLPRSTNISADEVLDLVSLFANTWLSLDAYDKSKLPTTGSSKSEIMFTAEELESAIQELKLNLIAKEEATDLFAQPKTQGSLKGIVGSIFQSAFGQDAYPSIEEKAAHILYFIIKNHPFNDGNKRSGAFAFVWFLSKAKLLNPNQITPETLTALTLLIAESDPKDKGRMIGLVLLLLRN